MAVCPPPPQQTEYDLRNAADCKTFLQGLFQAYTALVTGQRRIIVRFQDRWTEYQKSNAAELQDLYRTVYATCPDKSGLPDLNPNARMKRGAPARGFFHWPHH